MLILRHVLLLSAVAIFAACGKLDVCVVSDDVEITSMTYMTSSKSNPLERLESGLWKLPEPIRPSESHGPIVIVSDGVQYELQAFYDDGTFDTSRYMRIVRENDLLETPVDLKLEWIGSEQGFPKDFCTRSSMNAAMTQE